MTSQERSAASVTCIVFATISMLAALITAIFAINATSHVSDKLEATLELGYYRETGGGQEYEPFKPADPSDESTCHTGSAEEQPDQGFWSCAQKDSAAWSAQVAARQADAQAKGHLAIILALFGLTFAIGAVALNGGERSAPHTAAPSGQAPGPTAGPDPVPAQPRRTPDEQQPEPPAPL